MTGVGAKAIKPRDYLVGGESLGLLVSVVEGGL